MSSKEPQKLPKLPWEKLPTLPDLAAPLLLIAGLVVGDGQSVNAKHIVNQKISTEFSNREKSLDPMSLLDADQKLWVAQNAERILVDIEGNIKFVGGYGEFTVSGGLEFYNNSQSIVAIGHEVNGSIVVRQIPIEKVLSVNAVTQ